MNKRLIVYILGWVLIVEGAAMQIATVTSFIYGEHEGLYFLGVGALSALLGFHKENILLTAELRDNRKQEHDYAHTAQPMEKASPHKHSVAQCLNIGKYS